MDQAPSVIPANILSVIRAALNYGAGALLAKGAITDGQQDLVVGLGLAAVALAWSFVQNSMHKKALAQAIAAPAGLAKP